MSRHREALEDLGFYVGVGCRLQSTVGEPRYMAMVVSPAERLVATFNCEAGGEYAGAGWLVPEGREVETWGELLDALTRSRRGQAA